MIKIRKTQPTDITILMDIFEQAKHIMRKDGNMLQWRGNYPSREIVIADIEQGNSYVCTDDTEEIIGTFAFIRGNDPTYTHIYEGKWVEDTLPYGVIHRLASTEHSKGVANACLQWCYEQIPNLRADTHRDNHILQYILKKHGFKYCGIILLANGDERLAIPKSRRIDKETTNLSFKGVISRQVDLGVKANTRAYVFTEVSALTSSTPDGAERSDNSSNSFK